MAGDAGQACQTCSEAVRRARDHNRPRLPAVSAVHRLLIVVAVTASTVQVAAAQSDVPMRGIDHHNRLLLVRSRVQGKPLGVVLILTRLGAAPRVMNEVRGLGAQVQAHFDDVGYLRVRMPLAQFARLRAIPDVIDARIDAGYLSYGYDQGTDQAAVKLAERVFERTRAAFDTTTPLPPPLPAAARGSGIAPNPYVPMADMGSRQFTRAHPTYDGRGVTIGVLEFGVLDMTHPALQTARLITGEPVPKIAAIITASSYDPDPAPGATDSVLTRDTIPNVTRVRRTGPIDAREGSFSVEGRTYHPPRPGRYSFGVYTGYVKIPGGPYAVLWDTGGQVWVDTNRDRDFRNEALLGDFNRTHTTGYLRRDSTAAKAARSVAFAVAFDSGGSALHLYEGTQGHQTMVASVAAGHGLLGGVDASAPGARLIIVDAGGSLGGAIEGFIRAARDPRIDLITSSQVGETFPGAGESIFALVLKRLVDRYGKPIFAAAGNTGPRVSLPIEPANAPGVISVGGYVGRDTYLAHYGWRMASQDWLIAYSARGPTLDGAMKPDIVAPVLSIAAAPCSEEPKPARYLGYTLPPCYMLGGGTSSATPHAAGASALLLSAAKQAGVPYDAARLAWALRTSARFLPAYGVHEQGGGLIDLPKAWDLLRNPVQVPEIQVDAPTRTLMNPYLRRPGHGRGLYEREGWAPGDTGTRTITLTRTSGPRGTVTYGLRWRGNDGTFTVVPRRVSLPFDQPVAVRVHNAPRTPGIHSAALELVESSGLVVNQVLATIVAAHQLTAANGYTVHLRGSAEWPRPIPFFVKVLEGTKALRVEMRVRAGRLGLQHEDPATLDHLEWQTYFKGYRHPSSFYVRLTPGRSGVKLIPQPLAGVWELTATPVADPTFGGDSAQYLVPGDVELVVSAFAGTGTGPSDTLTFVNRLAPLAGATTLAELGARRVVTGTVDSSTAGPTYDLAVDSGTTSLRVAVERTSDALAHLTLYLFDCTTGTCFLWDADFVPATRAELLVHAPRPGKWKAVIDPARVPGGTTGFTYTEVTTSPAYGAVTVDTAATLRPTGARWIEPATVRAAGAIPTGRELVAVVDVVDRRSEADETAQPLAVFGGAPYRPIPVVSVVMPIASHSPLPTRNGEVGTRNGRGRPRFSKPPVTIEDLVTYTRIRNVRLSPDGKRVSYLTIRPLLNENLLECTLWLQESTAGSTPVALSRFRARAEEVWVETGELKHFGGQSAWSPDGRRLAYTGRTSDKVEVWLRDADGAATRVAGDYVEADLTGWTDDGTAIRFATADEPPRLAAPVDPSVLVTDDQSFFSSSWPKGASPKRKLHHLAYNIAARALSDDTTPGKAKGVDSLPGTYKEAGWPTPPEAVKYILRPIPSPDRQAVAFTGVGLYNHRDPRRASRDYF